MKHCLIIGSGLGGLSCGALLARHGFAVTVLEQGAQAGGCLQSFVRAGAKFETGMHFVGSADPGQAFRRLLHGFELDELPLERLDPAAYDVITLGRDEFPWANGAEAFVESLASSFPAERDGLHRYMQLVENIAAASPLRAATASDAALQAMMDYRLRSVDEVVGTLVRDPLLRRVLVGNAPLYAGRFGHTPFTSHAFITDFYNRSAFRIVGGSEQMAERLVRSIENRGGRVETRHRVVKIAHDGVRATGVYTADGQFFPADCVIAAVHPRRMLEMLEEGAPFRPAYRRRFAANGGLFHRVSRLPARKSALSAQQPLRVSGGQPVALRRIHRRRLAPRLPLYASLPHSRREIRHDGRNHRLHALRRGGKMEQNARRAARRSLRSDETRQGRAATCRR